jgi:hypothetical protein
MSFFSFPLLVIWYTAPGYSMRNGRAMTATSSYSYHNDKKIDLTLYITLYWDYKTSKSRIVTYLWLEYFDYVIIFQKRKLGIGTVYFLKTAYYVEGDSTRRNLQKNYEKREL